MNHNKRSLFDVFADPVRMHRLAVLTLNIRRVYIIYNLSVPASLHSNDVSYFKIMYYKSSSCAEYSRECNPGTVHTYIFSLESLNGACWRYVARLQYWFQTRVYEAMLCFLKLYLTTISFS